MKIDLALYEINLIKNWITGEQKMEVCQFANQDHYEAYMEQLTKLKKKTTIALNQQRILAGRR